MNSRHSQWADLFRAGFTQSEIAGMYEVSAQAVGKALRLLGVTRFEGGKSEMARVRVKTKSPKSAAHREWITAFENGGLMAEIADISDVSVAAVEKVLKRFCASVEAHEIARFKKLHGVCVSSFDSFEAAKAALDKFQTQRSRAKARGIGWQMNFSDWWSVWDESGKWPHRGVGMDAYVMAREGDRGPYASWNVRIDTSRNNLIEARCIRMNISRSQSVGYPDVINHE